MAAPLLHTRLPGDAAASASAVKTLGASRTGISNMRALENDFFNSPPRKTVRFGETVTEVLLKYKKPRLSFISLLSGQLECRGNRGSCGSFDDQIINWLLEFRSSIMYLTKDFEQLISIILECYVHNLLKISVYFPTLRHEILELIIEKLLKLDWKESLRQGFRCPWDRGCQGAEEGRGASGLGLTWEVATA
ncbi:hypothetical protein H8959_020180 [Pygathrix nigripes]